MAVVQATTLTVKPGRYQAFLDLSRRANAAMERSGSGDIRLLATLVGGEITGTITSIFEADDFAANGAVGDRFFADPEGQEIMATLGMSTTRAPSPVSRPSCGSTCWASPTRSRTVRWWSRCSAPPSRTAMRITSSDHNGEHLLGCG
jgi:hypothetical protein